MIYVPKCVKCVAQTKTAIYFDKVGEVKEKRENRKFMELITSRPALTTTKKNEMLIKRTTIHI